MVVAHFGLTIDGFGFIYIKPFTWSSEPEDPVLTATMDTIYDDTLSVEVNGCDINDARIEIGVETTIAMVASVVGAIVIGVLDTKGAQITSLVMFLSAHICSNLAAMAAGCGEGADVFPMSGTNIDVSWGYEAGIYTTTLMAVVTFIGFVISCVALCGCCGEETN
jgi:hypothetical protein